LDQYVFQGSCALEQTQTGPRWPHSEGQNIRELRIEFCFILESLSYHEVVHALRNADEEVVPDYCACRESGKLRLCPVVYLYEVIAAQADNSEWKSIQLKGTDGAELIQRDVAKVQSFGIYCSHIRSVCNTFP